jgi:hypothetical protein
VPPSILKEREAVSWVTPSDILVESEPVFWEPSSSLLENGVGFLRANIEFF